MNTMHLRPHQWYWVQKPNGAIIPYRLKQVLPQTSGGQLVEMFVGSMTQTFPASQIIGAAEMSDEKKTGEP